MNNSNKADKLFEDFCIEEIRVVLLVDRVSEVEHGKLHEGVLAIWNTCAGKADITTVITIETVNHILLKHKTPPDN